MVFILTTMPMTVMKETDSRMKAIHIVWILPIICAPDCVSINIIYDFAAEVHERSSLLTTFVMYKKNKAVDVHGDAIIRGVILKDQHRLIVTNHNQEAIQHAEIANVL
jgi:hypothetical protein